MAKASDLTWDNSLSLLLTGFTSGGLENQQSKCGNYFLEWTGNRLRQVKFIPGKRTDRP